MPTLKRGDMQIQRCPSSIVGTAESWNCAAIANISHPVGGCGACCANQIQANRISGSAQVAGAESMKSTWRFNCV